MLSTYRFLLRPHTPAILRLRRNPPHQRLHSSPMSRYRLKSTSYESRSVLLSSTSRVQAWVIRSVPSTAAHREKRRIDPELNWGWIWTAIAISLGTVMTTNVAPFLMEAARTNMRTRDIMKKCQLRERLVRITPQYGISRACSLLSFI